MGYIGFIALQRATLGTAPNMLDDECPYGTAGDGFGFSRLEISERAGEHHLGEDGICSHEVPIDAEQAKQVRLGIFGIGEVLEAAPQEAKSFEKDLPHEPRLVLEQFVDGRCGGCGLTGNVSGRKANHPIASQYFQRHGQYVVAQLRGSLFWSRHYREVIVTLLRTWPLITVAELVLGGNDMTLAHASAEARLPAHDLERARRWYADKLGLDPTEERPGGLRYQTATGTFCLFVSQGAPTGAFTQLGFAVDDLRGEMAALRARGVTFEDYDFPGLRTIGGLAEIEGNYPSKGRAELGAWFRDSEGNLLSIGQSLP
jgi:catechol 2,3-dioxygenase-like lactoylglutathione lyase family enzyme